MEQIKSSEDKAEEIAKLRIWKGSVKSYKEDEIAEHLIRKKE
jgi:hypothetical protein